MGPGIVVFISIDTIKKIGDKIINPIKLHKISTILFNAKLKVLTISPIYCHNFFITLQTLSKSSSVIFVSLGKHKPFSNSLSDTSPPI